MESYHNECLEHLQLTFSLSFFLSITRHAYEVSHKTYNHIYSLVWKTADPILMKRVARFAGHSTRTAELRYVEGTTREEALKAFNGIEPAKEEERKARV